MAIRLRHNDTEEFKGVTFPEYVLERYDIITGKIEDWAEVLYARSALELVRESLPAEGAALLDKADAFWKKYPKEFNEFSKYQHARVNLATALTGCRRLRKRAAGPSFTLVVEATGDHMKTTQRFVFTFLPTKTPQKGHFPCAFSNNLRRRLVFAYPALNVGYTTQNKHIAAKRHSAATK